MPSPFPGMDPFLEHYMWPDTHATLAMEIKFQLAAKLPPDLQARVEVNAYTEDIVLTRRQGYVPDVSVVDIYPDDDGVVREPAAAYGAETPATGEIDLVVPFDQRQYTVEIQNVNGNELIAAIEVLSPANKKQPNIIAYRKKRADFLFHGVHLLELDLLREGTRPFYQDDWIKATYAVQLINAHREKLKYWALTLADKFPNISLPLRHEEAPVLLDLNEAFRQAYDRSHYRQSINYSKPLKGPQLSKTDQAFMDSLKLK